MKLMKHKFGCHYHDFSGVPSWHGGFRIFKARAIFSKIAAGGAFAAGLVAVGTFAIGRVLIGMLCVKKAKISDMDINDLHIHNLRVDKKL